jgi:hypothetical protein
VGRGVENGKEFAARRASETEAGTHLRRSAAFILGAMHVASLLIGAIRLGAGFATRAGACAVAFGAARRNAGARVFICGDAGVGTAASRRALAKNEARRRTRER